MSSKPRKPFREVVVKLPLRGLGDAALLWPLCLLAALLSGCRSDSAQQAKELPVPKVTTIAVTEQETIDADEYTGWTEASEVVEVRSRVFGYLKTIDFKDGDHVTEGAPLFTIEADEYEAIHNQSLARINLYSSELEVNKAKLARRETLVKSGAVSREEYEEAVADVKASDAKIKSAEADAKRTAVDLKYTTINAPISGRIDRTFVSKGNLLTGGMSAGTLLTKIVQEQPMYVYFDVDERTLLGYMKKRKDAEHKPGNLRDANLKCYLKLADEKEFTHDGTVDFVATEVHSKTGTARIRATFPNKRRMLASGLFVRLRIPVSNSYKALMIPESALATDQSVKFVYVVGSDGIAERRLVTLGDLRGSQRIIASGLKAGEQIIAKGLQRVRPGQKVEAQPQKEQPAQAAPPSIAPSTTPDTPAVPGAGKSEGEAVPPKLPQEAAPANDMNSPTPAVSR